MGSKYRLGGMLAALVSLVGGLAAAQSVDPGVASEAARRGEQILREREALEAARQRENERQRQRPSGADLPPPPDATQGAPAGGCLDVRVLELVGARLLPEATRQRFRGDVAGHCLDARALDSLLKRITAEYVRLGYVTTRAYVPPQEARDGVLTIVVIEGTIESIEILPAGSASERTAFPGMRGQVFNLRDAEQGLDQLNRLRSNDARLDIRPGSAPGASILEVLNRPSRRFGASFSSDNNGSDETGLWQGTLTLTADNPLRLNDGLTLSLGRNLDDPRGPGGNDSAYLGYSLPYGWWTFNATASDSHYESVVDGLTRDFVTSGESRALGLKAERVAYRDRSRKVTWYAALNRRDGDNFIEGERIDSSSRVLTVLDLSGNLSIAQGRALWSFDAGVAKGLRWFGALRDRDEAPASAPRAQATRWHVGAAVERGFEVRGQALQLSSTLDGQWSDDVLFASEQLALAGPFAVRGYRDVRVYGDRGVTWRNEFALPLRTSFAGGTLALRPFVGLDVGRTFTHGASPGVALSGWAVGASLARAPLSLQVSWSGAGPRDSSIPSDHSFFARIAASY